MTTPALSPRIPTPPARASRYRLDAVSDDALHVQVKSLTGRHNALTAELLAHLAEVDARGIYRERACSSLYTYCVYELRLSEDEAQRRSRAARTARTFPVLFEMLAEGAIHLTGLLLLAPYLTPANHAELLARARFRTKREIEHLVAEIAPRPDVPARIEPLGPRLPGPRNSWQAYMASLRGAVRELGAGLGAGQAPPAALDEVTFGEADGALSGQSSKPLAPVRYRIEFTASERYVELLEEARNLLRHQVPDRDVARVHELAMAAFVEQLRKRRQAAIGRLPRHAGSGVSVPERKTNTVVEGPNVGPKSVLASERSAPARVRAVESAGSAPERLRVERSQPSNGNGRRSRGKVKATRSRYVPAEIRRAVWQRDGGCCTFEDSRGWRCSERAGLEIHHDRAFALGGPTTVENLRLACRAHNALLAERDFGREHMQRIVRRAKGKGARDPAGSLGDC